MSTSDAEELKAAGNAAFSAGRYAEAAEHFSEAIRLDASNHVYFSNRSAAHASMGQFRLALADAQSVVELMPKWPKGYSRLGAALFGLRQWDKAMAAYSKGLQLDPANQQLKQGLADVQAARNRQAQPQNVPLPPSGAAAGDRLGPTGQLVLLVAHTMVVLSSIVSLQPFSRSLGWQAYFVCCRTMLVLSSFKAYLRFGLPSLRPFPAAFKLWSGQVAASAELWHILMSAILMQTPALWMGVVPLALQCVIPLLPALGARFSTHLLWQRYGLRSQAWLEANKAYVLQFVATAEIAMGFQMVLAVLQRGLQGAIMAFVYWSHLRLRALDPESRPYHQQIWRAIDARIQPLLAAVPTLRRYLDAAKRWFNAPGHPQQHQQ